MDSLYDLIPHREPMLLLNSVVELRHNFSHAEIIISDRSSFYIKGKGVPSWIGIEYMGQTAALIAGHQLREGRVTPHVGLLLGSRHYQAFTPWFCSGAVLRVTCTEIAVVGTQLATFQCEIRKQNDHCLVAAAKLSVYRKPLEPA